MNDKAIVTLALGERYLERWRAACEPNWRAYAARHGYDVICLDAPLDLSARAAARSPAWQKCLVLGHPQVERYARVVWMDADVVVNPAAPDLAAGVPPNRVGAVDEYATPTHKLHRQNLLKMYEYWKRNDVPFIENETGRDYYLRWGLPGGFDEVVQTGVMVLSPTHHRALLEGTYLRYEDRGPAWNYEMRPLSYELLNAGAVHWLDPRFNMIWGIYKALYYPFLWNHSDHPRLQESLLETLSRCYCLHFAGGGYDMPRTDLATQLGETSSTAGPVAALRPTPAAGLVSEPPLRAPVALFLYARPDTTAQVFQAIRAARPLQLFLVADGPRAGDPAGAARCAAARDVVAQVDWDCAVATNYAPSNLGLKARIETGLDWLFAQVEEAIVLEDDCLPDPSFFHYAAELLARFRDEPRVMNISGSNFQFRARHGDASYYWSRYPHVWGWATWRRAWRHYDGAMRRWPELRGNGWLEDLLGDPRAARYWSLLFEQVFSRGHTWDYPWLLACWLNDGLSAVPNSNLVTNLGFRADATHTRENSSLFSNMPLEPLAFPLTHPASMAREVEADTFTEEILFSGNLTRMMERVKKRHRARRAQVQPAGETP